MSLKSAIKLEMKDVKDISVTCDHWDQRTKKNTFFTLTVHYIKDGKLENRVLTTKLTVSFLYLRLEQITNGFWLVFLQIINPRKIAFNHEPHQHESEIPIQLYRCPYQECTRSFFVTVKSNR